MPHTGVSSNRKAIVAYIRDQLKLVDPTAPIIFGHPYIKTIEDALEHYIDRDRHLHYWVVERFSTEPMTHEVFPEIPTRFEVHYYHTIRVHLWYSVGVLSQESLQDEDQESRNSAETVEDLADAVLDHFKTIRSLGGEAWSTPQPLGLVSKDIEFGAGNFLCHHAVFALTAIDPQYNLAPS